MKCNAAGVFIHNRVENSEVAGMWWSVPDARIRVGHGQMDGKVLEETLTLWQRSTIF